MKQGQKVILWTEVDDWEVGLIFTYTDDCWICKFGPELMKELAPLTIENES